MSEKGELVEDVYYIMEKYSYLMTDIDFKEYTLNININYRKSLKSGIIFRNKNKQWDEKNSYDCRGGILHHMFAVTRIIPIW